MGNENKIAPDVGTFYIDEDGAGRIYIPKGITEAIHFENKTKVKITPDNGKLIIERLDTEG